MEKQETKETSLQKIKQNKDKLLPFILCAVAIISDQVTKAIVAANVAVGETSWSCFNGFFAITHRRNPGVAFSLGATWPLWMRKLIFIVIPILVIAYVIKLYMKSEELTKLQRWSICGVIGGGIGNLIDRTLWPHEGVIDFIDVQWFGWTESPFSFFRMDRFATFNVGDSFVVVCGAILIVTFIVMYARHSKEAKKEKAAKKNK